MMDPKDLEACREAIRQGSHSFHAASKVLPARVRDPALALYAFCRLADDAVDLQRDKHAAVLSLRDRLDLIYRGRPRNAAADRAFAGVIEAFEMPRALPDALLEGLAWDALDKRYDSLSDLNSYCARVASAVGVMMCVLMRVRDADALARAADLGVAMQLTNIARDVGEDALEQRLYLPQNWMHEAGLPPEAFLARPEICPEIRGFMSALKLALANCRWIAGWAFLLHGISMRRLVEMLPRRAMTAFHAGRVLRRSRNWVCWRNHWHIAFRFL